MVKRLNPTLREVSDAVLAVAAELSVEEVLEAEAPFRARDVHDHPRFRGWWPEGHPEMRSFIGVPIVAPEGVIGAFCLTEKIGAHDFGDLHLILP